MPAINAHGEFTPTPENHMTPRPHPSVTRIGSIKNEPRNLSLNNAYVHNRHFHPSAPDLATARDKEVWLNDLDPASMPSGTRR